MKKLIPFVCIALSVVCFACASLQGGGAGESVAVIVLYNRAEIVGATSLHTGIFLTNDEGETWQHTGWNNVRGFGAAFDSVNGARRMFLAAGNGIHRSTDGGATWKVVTGWEITEAMRVAIDPVNPRLIYIATAYGIYTSSDGGDAWRKNSDGLQSHFTSSLLAANAQGDAHASTYCGTEEGLYVSMDNAAHWARCDGDHLKGIAVLDIQQCYAQPKALALATQDSGVWLSTDGGMHWNRKSNGLPAAPFYSVAFNPENPSICYAAGFETGVWKTTNGGELWKAVNGDSLAQKSFHAIAVSRVHPDEVFAGEYNGGVWRSRNGGESWQCMGLEGSQIWQIVVF